MTALIGGSGDDTQVLGARAATATAVGLAADVPVPAPGLQLLGTQPGSGYVVPPALVRRSDGQVLQLTPLIYAVLEAIDGLRDSEQVARAASSTAGRTLVADDVRTLLDSRLRPLGLVLRADGTQAETAKANPLLALRPKVVVSSPRWTRRLTAPFAALFHPALVVVTTLAFAAVAYWVLFDKGLGSAAYEAFSRPGLLLTVFLITVVSAGFHEFGHAAALRRGGGTPGAMGAGLYLVWPAFYTDVTDSYRLSRAARIRVDLGGLYFNALVALAMFGLWLGVRWDGLLLVIAAQILQMIRQLPPLVRFDGYHLLADVTGVPDLFHRIGPALRSFLPRRWRHADSRALRPWVRVVVTSWVLVVVPILIASAAVSIIAMPRILGTTWHSVSAQASALSARAAHGDPTGAAVKALAIAALVIPVGGMLLMTARAGRSYGLRIWRGTRGRPRQRAAASVACLGLLAGLAYAWWPHGSNYRPIEPYERGTIQDALPATFHTHLQAGLERRATTVWADDGQPLPTPDRPALALVMSPRSSNAPTWVFPFNRPAPPGPGDNQSMAIVTRDGGVVYDVAFALVWADKDTVLNRNEAYAFASCHSCRAVAVSFQVVLVLGHAHVVAPQNIAAAVNYRCVVCVAQAAATQLVLTLPQRLSGPMLRQLNALWAHIVFFEHHLRGLSFSAIQSAVAAFERQIIAIVRPDLTAPGPAPGVVSASASASASGSASTQPAPASTSATPGPGSTDAAVPAQSTPAQSSPASPSPSTSSSPAGSPSPSPSATST